MNSFDKLKGKLAELFQLDQADLDFGIYRIMNARRDEITRFLDQDLLPQVREAFSQYESSDKALLKKQLEEAENSARSLGVPLYSVPKVKELREKYEVAAVDVAALESEVYDHLFTFFSRYYDEGDFISLRRYKQGVYAIPYEGEEVKLHWANSDQYYVKTTESFRDYAFKTPGGRVHFKIVDADTEKDNVKAADGTERRFVLEGDPQVAEANGELVVRFAYRADEEKRKQEAINAETVARILAALDDEKLARWRDVLCYKWRRADGTIADRTVLEKYLYDYTRRNTFDYFIHKDLGRFLRNELDFYIKNEVIRLDDVEEESAPRVEQYLSKIKVIRRIAHKIIDFLAQIEDFQKKLWLKKKFVIETNYCVTLDRVPEALYPEISANDGQRQEWVRLFAIDEIKGDLWRPAYSNPLSIEFLKANPSLMMDTKFFDAGFKARLTGSIEDFEDECEGLLAHSENFQALSLLNERYRGKIKCLYIDPPYNTDAGPILYKNGYRASSWIALMHDRLLGSGSMLAADGAICVTIDDYQVHELAFLLDQAFGRSNHLGTAVIRNNPSGRSTVRGLSVCHEYAFFYRRTEAASLKRLPRSEKQLERFTVENGEHVDWRNFRKDGGAVTHRAQRPKQYYPLYINPETKSIRIPALTWDKGQRQWTVLEEPGEKETAIWPIDEKGRERVWSLNHLSALAGLSELEVRNSKAGGIQVFRRHRPTEGVLPRSWWDKSTYAAREHGSAMLTNLFGGPSVFPFAKSPFAVQDCLWVSGLDSKAESYVLDFFAGSGTTGQAVIELNRQDEGERKYILVEMGDYFDSTLKPRVQKVVYSKDWKDGKPVSREGSSHMFKYIRLESYEDALANIDLRRTPVQQSLLDRAEDFRESYLLKYALDAEAKGSQAMLNVENFDDPFNYKLLVGTGSVGETRAVNVDLVETFNWLLGLKVRHIDLIQGFRVVEGENPEDQKVLVIWRKIRDLAETDPGVIATARERSNRELGEFFRKQQYNALDSEFDLIYVNGDNNLMNVPLAPAGEGQEPRYKVRLIEEEFQRLMFDVEGV
ncbi:MAG: site-specific DNA-methyltransferase [Chloroflexi bacterium]|nr:site-specific DNA-methyltransferase [Chloroflexota bacterium]